MIEESNVSAFDHTASKYHKNLVKLNNEQLREVMSVAAGIINERENPHFAQNWQPKNFSDLLEQFFAKMEERYELTPKEDSNA